MDPQTGGLLGACIGSFIGLLGGVAGTYFAIKNTNGRRERAFAIKASIVCWILVLGFVAAMLLIPTWHKHLLWIPYAIALSLGIRYWNKIQFRIRHEESGDSPHPIGTQ